MPDYRRFYAPGDTVFVTVVTYKRRPHFAVEENAAILLSAIRRTKELHPFKHIAHVILPDHLHWMFRVLGPSNFSAVVSAVKRDVTWRLKDQGKCVDGFWQRRFFDHVIRDNADFARHLDYIHFNPVKHHLASSAANYRLSSFAAWAARGVYEPGWGSEDRPPKNVSLMSLE